MLSGLGGNTARTWLKIPVCEDYERVVRATTMPLLMLGGASHNDPEPTIREFARGLTRRAERARGHGGTQRALSGQG